MNFFDFYANPYRFEKLGSFLMPLFLILGCLLTVIGLYIGVFVAPPDYQQLETVRIMYIHVPSAWLAMGIFLFMGICASFFLVRKHQLAAILVKSAAPIGTAFSLICLITGALWGRPTWGTYWIWDARLTSMLVLFFIYFAFIMIHFLIDDFQKACKISSIFVIVGLIDLPIIKFSVEWWHSLHQGASVIKAGGPSIHETMLYPLIISAAGLCFIASGLIIMGALTLLNKLKVNRYIQKKVRQNG